MSRLTDLLSTLLDRRPVFRRAGRRDQRPIRELSAELLGNPGEFTQSELARQVLERYAALADDAQLEFFRFLNDDLDLDPAELRAALDQYDSDRSPHHYRQVTRAAEPRRQRFLQLLHQVPDATSQLVTMRADLLSLLDRHPDLAKTDLDFKSLFTSWFNRGFLVIQPIDWSSPAQILEKIIAYEAVHTIESWEDLRRRTQPADRRCYAFFHPAMPDEPLIFVEVALVSGTPNSIQQILAESREELSPTDADTAVFYSITNCQRGLDGISFGSSLIKHVVETLSREFSEIRNFVTLSPIPRLVQWMQGEGIDPTQQSSEQLQQAAAHYLLNVKRSDQRPRDSVARFHLNNGAFLSDVHADADSSDNGIAQSAGVMVNYLYDLKRVSQNHESYAAEHEVVASRQVRSLARGLTLPSAAADSADG